MYRFWPGVVRGKGGLVVFVSNLSRYGCRRYKLCWAGSGGDGGRESRRRGCLWAGLCRRCFSGVVVVAAAEPIQQVGQGWKGSD